MIVLSGFNPMLNSIHRIRTFFKVYFQCGRWNFANKLHVGSCFYDSLYVERRKLKTP